MSNIKLIWIMPNSRCTIHTTTNKGIGLGESLYADPSMILWCTSCAPQAVIFHLVALYWILKCSAKSSISSNHFKRRVQVLLSINLNRCVCKRLRAKYVRNTGVKLEGDWCLENSTIKYTYNACIAKKCSQMQSNQNFGQT